MTNNSNKQRRSPGAAKDIDDETFARLVAESKTPYRGLRKFIYIAFAGSGAIGAFVFLTQWLAGRDVSDTLPNLALQLGVIALMVWLLRLENKADRDR